MGVYVIYVEKKGDFAQEAASVAADLHLGLQIDGITKARVINRYFAEGICEQDFRSVKNTIFSEPQVDTVYDELPDFETTRVFAVEYLPGQFDQRADSCAQCISLATGKERPNIQSAKIYAICGNISNDDFNRIKSWLINPVESRQASLEIPLTLKRNLSAPSDVPVIEGFISLEISELEKLCANLNLAMDLQDLLFCQKYFRDDEKRDPTLTEIRLLDTYWSDHCRHTTFLTELDEIKIEDETVNESYKNYLDIRSYCGRADKPVTLMDMATIGARALKQKGLLPDLDASEEINACSVKIKVDVDGKERDWLLMFKNETHNHPTEIEPFGGAATCLGGAIRDPLSGRAFVYQAMRVTGAANPLKNANETLPGKLPQRKICRTAAAGYSSYGNQIGLATGLVHEIYHPGYEAKRMEIGAVIGAAPIENVVRAKPSQGDVVILLGGRTGRDGIGGATGSSKSHSSSSLETCGADVQKGNAPEERKLQRLFRNPNAARLIKRCNDFGAGGVSVSVGELADGLSVDLNKILKKYEGLDGTELAISESQERMSVVTSKKDAQTFIALAEDENLEAVIIAEVTKNSRLVMNWNGKTIVNIKRDFLNSNGAEKHTKAQIKKIEITKADNHEAGEKELEALLSGLDICSQKGLVDRFDSCIGAATVVAPFGGKYFNTPAQVMAAKIPVLNGETKTCSLMSWGFDPYISSVSPYHGAVFAVVHSVAKIIASGGSRKKCWLTFQEYFEKLRDDPVRWGKPASALLGALDAQIGLETAAIGGKDSMSGSFSLSDGGHADSGHADGRQIDVPPTLVSFAVSTAKLENIVTPEFKKTDSYVYLLKPPFSVYEKCDFAALRVYFDNVEKLIKEGKILSAWACGSGGTAEAVVKMCMGNRIGFSVENELFTGTGFCGFVVETDAPLQADAELLGRTTTDYTLKIIVSDIQTPDTNTVSDIKTSDNNTVSDIQTPDTNTVSDIKTPDTDTVSDIKTPDTDTVSDIKTPDTDTVSDIKTPDTNTVNDIQTPDTDTVSDIKTTDTDTVSDIKTPLISKTYEIPLDKLQDSWEKTLEPVYPCLVKQEGKVESFSWKQRKRRKNSKRGVFNPFSKPMFVIPVFPGTNSEYDSARAVEKAGGRAEIFVIRNLTPAAIAQSVKDFEKLVRKSQVIFIPGGFSGGDEPDGSGKFITAFMRNSAVKYAVTELIKKRDGLICGICNGFQALIKLGLVPYGEIRDMTEDSPTLTFNTIGRHQSTLINTKIVSNKSPWLSHLESGAQYIVPISHGEGRFIAQEKIIRSLAANGQIATQYVDYNGNASQDIRFNPNNSDFAIEGITSPDGRVFGRMAHNERFDDGLYKNIPGIKKMDIFAGAVRYFR